MRMQKFEIVSAALLIFGLGLSIAPQSASAAAKTIDAELSASLDKSYKEMTKGDYSAAITTLTAAVKTDPDSVTARRYLAFALVKSGKSLAAIDQLNAITKLVKPTYFEWCTYGEAYLHAGDYSQAASCYKAAISLAPKADYAKSGLIRVNMQNKNYEEALNLAKEGMKDAANPQVYDYYKKLYSGVLAASTAPQASAPVAGVAGQSSTQAVSIESTTPGMSREEVLKRITSGSQRPRENHPGG